jgi:hypothetical protein
MSKKVEVNHDFKPGDVLSASWGYGQTNIDFYLVKELVGKSTLVLVELHKNMVPTENFECYHSSPDIVDNGDTVIFRTKPETFRVRARKDSEYVKISYSQYAKKWSGKPEYETKYY